MKYNHFIGLTCMMFSAALFVVYSLKDNAGSALVFCYIFLIVGMVLALREEKP